MPLRYAIVLVFDKAWASSANRLGLREGTYVYNPTERGITAELERIRTVDISQYRVIRPEQPIFGSVAR
jgi:hypothetical protein